MPDLSPELMDVLALLKQVERESRAEADRHKYRRHKTSCLIAANALADARGMIEAGVHIGAHERARKGGG